MLKGRWSEFSEGIDPGMQGAFLQAVKTHCQWNQLSQHLCVFPVNEKDEEMSIELCVHDSAANNARILTLGILFLDPAF